VADGFQGEQRPSGPKKAHLCSRASKAVEHSPRIRFFRHVISLKLGMIKSVLNGCSARCLQVGHALSPFQLPQPASSSSLSSCCCDALHIRQLPTDSCPDPTEIASCQHNGVIMSSGTIHSISIEIARPQSMSRRGVSRLRLTHPLHVCDPPARPTTQLRPSLHAPAHTHRHRGEQAAFHLPQEAHYELHYPKLRVSNNWSRRSTCIAQGRRRHGCGEQVESEGQG